MLGKGSIKSISLRPLCQIVEVIGFDTLFGRLQELEEGLLPCPVISHPLGSHIDWEVAVGRAEVVHEQVLLLHHFSSVAQLCSVGHHGEVSSIRHLLSLVKGKRGLS